MYLSRQTHYFNAIKSSVKTFSTLKNHYEVLNLRRNCTDKEIKEAFIQMSKEYHPDINKDEKAQEKFVRIVEAYNVLGKPGSRAMYDSVSHTSSRGPSPYVYRYPPHNVYKRKNPAYSNFYYQRTTENNTNRNTKQEQASHRNSYTIFGGLNRMPNRYIICICFGVAFVGVLIQLVVISLILSKDMEKNMYKTQRAKALERSRILAEELQRVRNAAIDNGNELQTRLLLEKIVTAANPTVTTASLGQALASEKKDGLETLLTEFGILRMPEWYNNAAERQKVYNLKLTFETW